MARTYIKETIQASNASKLASEKYNDRFNNVLYAEATKTMTSKYANQLIDDAMALCGDPFFSLTRIRWGAKAKAFLAQFKVDWKDEALSNHIHLTIDPNRKVFWFTGIKWDRNYNRVSGDEISKMEDTEYNLTSQGYRRI